MKSIAILILTVLATSALAAEPSVSKDKSTPEFAAGWRVSGIMRMGGQLQASLEKAGFGAKFVTEGRELTPGVVVEKIDNVNRNVTLRCGDQTAVIRSGSAPVLVVSNTNANQPAAGNQPPRPWQMSQGRPVAAQDEQGRWGIRLDNGQFFSAQDYIARHGGYDKAIEHINQRMAETTDPGRRAFGEQMMTALQNMGPSAAPNTIPMKLPKQGKSERGSRGKKSRGNTEQ